jgi:hypothetical protein
MTQGQAGRERPPRQEGDPTPRPDSEARRRAAPITRQEFRVRFDRCFSRVYAYVSRRVSDRETCERIVREVLTASVDLLVERTDERRELSWIKALSDRWIALEAESRASAEQVDS